MSNKPFGTISFRTTARSQQSGGSTLHAWYCECAGVCDCEPRRFQLKDVYCDGGPGAQMPAWSEKALGLTASLTDLGRKGIVCDTEQQLASALKTFEERSTDFELLPDGAHWSVYERRSDGKMYGLTGNVVKRKNICE